ncbi:hypothetical protein HDV02_002240 [Globomyces sp. JEL0801]|nr:hypothetical protein HDV02_002240 [Globomyces sp. JEL0801]
MSRETSEFLRERYPDVKYSSVQLSKLWKEADPNLADPNLKKMFQNQAKELGNIYSKAMEIYRSIQFTESLMTKNSNSEKYQSHIKLLKSYRDLNTLNVELNRNNSTSPTSWPINEPFFLDISSTEKQLDLIRFEHVNQNDILIPNTYPNLN